MSLSIRIWHTTITYNHIPIPIRTTKKKTLANVRVSKESTYFNAKSRFY
ncbi:unknown [Prevotella sp. CAG:873]|nr:unknown [Prevotella sp. CAG:873]